MIDDKLCEKMRKLQAKDCTLNETLSHLAKCHECRQAFKSEADRISKEETQEIVVRPEIMEFAEEMERVMKEHDPKKGDSWKKCLQSFLMGKLDEEYEEFCEVYKFGNEKARKEAIDCANILMMLFHRCAPKGVK